MSWANGTTLGWGRRHQIVGGEMAAEGSDSVEERRGSASVLVAVVVVVVSRRSVGWRGR